LALGTIEAAEQSVHLRLVLLLDRLDLIGEALFDRFQLPAGFLPDLLDDRITLGDDGVADAALLHEHPLEQGRIIGKLEARRIVHEARGLPYPPCGAPVDNS